MAAGTSILLIEENDADARELIASLSGELASWRLERLSDPSEAKERLLEAVASRVGSGLPSAIILALGIEPRVGFEFLRWLRREVQLNSVVVIALGQQGRMREIQEAYANGANAFFLKGRDVAALIRTLQSSFAREESSHRPDTHPAFRSSTDLYRRAEGSESKGMATPAPLLLVDDDVTQEKVFAQSLEKLRIRNPLRRVNGADEAIACLQEWGRAAERGAGAFPGVVFLNIRLADSHKLLAWLEGHPALRPAGVIAVTSSHDMRPVIQAYHLGVHSFLKEPPKLEELRNALTAIANAELIETEGGIVMRARGSG